MQFVLCTMFSVFFHYNASVNKIVLISDATNSQITSSNTHRIVHQQGSVTDVKKKKKKVLLAWLGSKCLFPMSKKNKEVSPNLGVKNSWTTILETLAEDFFYALSILRMEWKYFYCQPFFRDIPQNCSMCLKSLWINYRETREERTRVVIMIFITCLISWSNLMQGLREIHIYSFKAGRPCSWPMSSSAEKDEVMDRGRLLSNSINKLLATMTVSLKAWSSSSSYCS